MDADIVSRILGGLRLWVLWSRISGAQGLCMPSPDTLC